MTGGDAMGERVYAVAGGCDYCGGSGEVFSHAEDCHFEYCALAGGIDDCNGKVEPCGACDFEAVDQARAQPEQRAVVEAQETIRDALLDSQYLAGAKAGWNAAQSDDPEKAYAALQKSREGHLAGYKEARAALDALEAQP